MEGTRLTIKGAPEKPETEPAWLHQGRVSQPFSLSFTLEEHMDVSGAAFINGLLHIDIMRAIPDASAPQRIAIRVQTALHK